MLGSPCRSLPVLGILFLHWSFTVMMFSRALDLWLVVSAACVAKSWGCVQPTSGSGVLGSPAPPQKARKVRAVGLGPSSEEGVPAMGSEADGALRSSTAAPASFLQSPCSTCSSREGPGEAMRC